VDKIRAAFELSPPMNVNQAHKRIEQLKRLKRGITQVRKFVKYVLKFRYRKFRPLPGGKQAI
jgi:hypothetical protein